MLSERDPLAKLAIAFAAIGVATLTQRLTTLAIVAAVLAVDLLVIERLPLRKLAIAMAPFAFFAVTSAWIYAIAPNPAYRAVAGSGWPAALLVGTRTLTVGLVSVAFAATTEPADLARALVRRARLPRRFVFGALAAMQFLPALAEEARMARMVARASLQADLRTARASLVRRLHRAVAGLGPAIGIMLLASAVRRAGAAALAMELRGLGEARTELVWRVPAFRRQDLALCSLAAAVLFAAWWAG